MPIDPDDILEAVVVAEVLSEDPAPPAAPEEQAHLVSHGSPGPTPAAAAAGAAIVLMGLALVLLVWFVGCLGR